MAFARSDAPIPIAAFRSQQGRRLPLLLAAVFVVALLAVSTVTSIWTAYLWFREDVGHVDTWERIWSAKLTLFFAGGAFAFAVVSIALLVAERLAPTDVVFQHNDPLLVVRSFTARRQNLTRNLVAGLCGLTFGPTTARLWEKWTLFRFAPNEATAAEQTFGRGPNFYLFRLPFLRDIASWTFGVFVVAAVLALVAFVFSGAIRLSDDADSRVRVGITREAKALLSALLGFVFVARALCFYFDRYALAFATHARFAGVSYVDRLVRSHAYSGMAVISLLCALILFANVFKQRSDVAVATIASWLIIAPILLFAVPGIWQRFAVSNELEREKPAIARHIAATREAYELTDVTPAHASFVNPEDAVASTAANRTSPNLRNVRIWDTSLATNVATNVVDSAQKGNPKYRIADVDVVPGDVSSNGAPLLVGVRELAAADADASWVNTRLVYTHGYGVVAAPVNEAANGEPVFSLKDLPVTGTPKVSEPRIYYGETMSNYVVVNTSTQAVDIAGEKQTAAPKFRSESGITLSSRLRRLAFGWKYQDLDFVVSKSIGDSSKLLSNRSIRDRVHAIAPFLRLDGDPYPVVHRGRVLWIIEAYVTSRNYPNSDRSSIDSLVHPASDLRGSYSYIRNSVRVVVDAYGGEVRFFRTDKSEPIAAALARAFPTLFDLHTLDGQYPGLSKQLRYPSDLFNIRANLWGRFHVESPQQFYDESDRWTVGASSAKVLKEPGATGVDSAAVASTLAPPEYVSTDPDGTGKQRFLVQQALVAMGRKGEAEAASAQRLRALVYSDASPQNYGHFLVTRVPAGLAYNSPASGGQEFSSDPEIGQKETDLGRGGSEVVNGEMQIVRVGTGLLYVRPVYVQADDPAKRRPRLRFVEVRFGPKIALAPSLDEALAKLFVPAQADSEATDGVGPDTGSNGGAATGDGNGSALDPSDEKATVAELLAKAVALDTEAQAALKAGDLGGYKAANDKIARLTKRASDKLGTASAAPTSSSPSTSSSPPK